MKRRVVSGSSPLRARRPHHNDYQPTHRSIFVRFLVALLIATPLIAASPSTRSIKLGERTGSVEIVRCHFNEGRIVVRHDDTLHVLRKGGALEGTGLQIAEITPEAATLTIREIAPNGSLRIIRITKSDHGALLLREYATDPASLAGGSSAYAPATPLSATAPGKTRSNPDGD